MRGSWGPRQSKTASEGPRRLPRGTRKAPKPEKRDPKTNPILTSFLAKFWEDFGDHIGAQKCSKTGSKKKQKWNQFQNRLPRISGVWQVGRSSFLRGCRKAAGWLEIYPAKEREGLADLEAFRDYLGTLLAHLGALLEQS